MLMDDTRACACRVDERAQPVDCFVLADDGLFHLGRNFGEALVVSSVHAQPLPCVQDFRLVNRNTCVIILLLVVRASFCLHR